MLGEEVQEGHDRAINATEFSKGQADGCTVGLTEVLSELRKTTEMLCAATLALSSEKKLTAR